VLKGHILGGIKHIYNLTMSLADCWHYVTLFFQKLQAHGYPKSWLTPIFTHALCTITPVTLLH
jgi:hypothetical protein